MYMMINRLDYEFDVETWNASCMKMGSAVVMFDYLEDDYIWIYFFYADSKRDGMRLWAEFLKRYLGIIEFRTKKPELFRNHISYRENGIYRWERSI